MMTTDTQTGDDFDLDAIADSWLGTPAEPEKETEGTEPEGDGGEAPATPEAPNGVPTQQATITPEQEEEIFTRRLNQQLERARQAKAEKDLQALLDTGTDEDIAQWTKDKIQQQQAQAARDAIAQEAAAQTALETINNLLDDEFVASLTPEEAQTLLPEKFAGKTDRDYMKAITDLKASKARAGLYTEEDVERLVNERIQAAQNVRRGNQFSNPSPSQTPAALASEDRHAGKEGNQLKDSLWQEIAEGWADNE